MGAYFGTCNLQNAVYMSSKERNIAFFSFFLTNCSFLQACSYRRQRSPTFCNRKPQYFLFEKAPIEKRIV